MHRLLAMIGIVMALLAFAGPARAEITVGQDTLNGVAFVIYRETTEPSFRFACQAPCPIPDGTLRSALTGFRNAKALLIPLWGIDVLPELAPVDILFERNTLCTSAPGSAVAYATTYRPYGSGGPLRGLVCLFQWDRFVAGALGAEWFTPEHAGDLERQVLILHEYGHVILYQRHFASYENVVTYYSFRATGALPLPQGPCTGEPLASFAPLINVLCVVYGMDDAEQRASWQALDQVYQQGGGYGLNGGTDRRTSISQWRRELDRATGRSTAGAFVLGNGASPQSAGAEFDLTPAAARIDAVDGRFRLDVPAGAVSQATPMKLEAGTCGASHPNLDFALVFDLVAGNHRNHAPLPWPIFNAPVQLRYAFAHARFDSVEPRSLRLYRLSAPCSTGVVSWIEVPNARLDPVRRLLTAPITQGGTYALLPAAGTLPGIVDARVLPHAGPWYQASTSGQGFDIEYHTDHAGLAITWYTYRPDGTPIWYQSVGSLTADGQTAPLTEVTRNPDGSRTITNVGQLRVRFTTPETAVLDWSIGAQSGSMPDLVFLRFSDQPTVNQANGLWFPPDDPGWGTSIWSQGPHEFWVYYIYDTQGRPVWLSSLLAASDFSVTLKQNRGACPWCPYAPPTAVNAGTFFRQHMAAGSAQVLTNMALASPLQGTWTRSRRIFLNLTDYVAER